MTTMTMIAFGFALGAASTLTVALAFQRRIAPLIARLAEESHGLGGSR